MRYPELFQATSGQTKAHSPQNPDRRSKIKFEPNSGLAQLCSLFLALARSCSLLPLALACSSSLLVALPRSCSLCLARPCSSSLLSPRSSSLFLPFEPFAKFLTFFFPAFVASCVLISFLRFRFSPLHGYPPYLHLFLLCLSHVCCPSFLVSSLVFFSVCSG